MILNRITDLINVPTTGCIVFENDARAGVWRPVKDLKIEGFLDNTV